jgi:heme exporter protein A
MSVTGQGAMAETARVSIRGLACRRGGRLLFADLTFALERGQAAHVSGPNGVGKSSLLRLLCGLLPPFAGTIAMEGAISLTDDRLALDPDQPLSRALAFWSRLDGQPDAARAAALQALGLAPLADVPVRMLSTGQRKRATIARTLASGAPIWLLDEPANGLDEHSITLLGIVVQAHLRAGGIVIAASHQPLPWQSDIAFTLAPPMEPGA